MTSSKIPDLQSHTVAWFGSSAQVRAAESALERAGIESSYIEVGRPKVSGERRQIDRKTFSSLGTRAAIGAVVGAVVGALVGLGLGLLFGNSGGELMGFAMAAGIAGVPLGAILMVFTRLPTQEQSFDTYGGDPTADEWIAIGGPDELQSEAAQILQRQDPVRIDGVAA